MFGTIPRQHQYTRSNVTCVVWTEGELALLREVRAMIGNDWHRIAAEFFPGRSANQVKCKSNYLARVEREGVRKPAPVSHAPSRPQVVQSEQENGWPSLCAFEEEQPLDQLVLDEPWPLYESFYE